MNNNQLKHIAAALHAIAFAQFAVFGYTGLIIQPVAWVQLILSTIGFFNIECVAVWVLSYVRDSEN
ncbi:hypothetical protein ABXJ76_01230 [Methylobacter sp. G7]|uniref:hypothetical protein n=1 Tax=Methylobacter sp. G7 TaxID=3230117 RepID=UPI003D807B13